jgi:high-affinity iron transporter
MLAALLIVFREVIEAGLIVGIVLAATQGVVGRGRWIAAGIAGGIVGACLVAVFAGRIASWFAGSGQELFNSAVLAAAVAMLTWHNVWMAGHGRAMARDMRRLGADVTTGKRPVAALAIVCCVAVLREGSEVALFLYGVAASGNTSAAGMITGGVIGLLAGVAVSTLTFFGLLVIPAHRLFSVTSGLITLLAAGLASQAVAFVQQAGCLEVLTSTVWNSSALLSDDSLVGRMAHTLIGYTAEPSGAQVVVYLVTFTGIVVLMRFAGGSHAGGPGATSAEEP